MTHLNIQQGLNIEVVSTNLIKKLYEVALSVPEPLEGELDAAYMSGNLLVDKSYRSLVEYLTNRFDDLHINVTAGYYMLFHDSAVNDVLKDTIGDGVGVLIEEFLSITNDSLLGLGSSATAHPEITDFREGCLLTGLTSLSTGFAALSGVTTFGFPPNVVNYPGGSFASNIRFDGVVVKNINNFINRNGTNLWFVNGYYLYDMDNNGNLTRIDTLTLPSAVSFPNGINKDCLCGVKLEELIIPSSCTYITSLSGPYLKKISFESPSSLTTIEANTFWYGPGWTNSTVLLNVANLPLTITTIGNNAFRSCSNITGILDLHNLISLGQYSFCGTGITSIADLGSVTTIPEGCFLSCAALTSINIPNGITLIQQSAFEKESNTTISDFSISSTVTYIGPTAFGRISAPNAVIYLPGITGVGNNGTLDNYAFNYPYQNKYFSAKQYYFPNITKTGSNAYGTGPYYRGLACCLSGQLIYLKNITDLYPGAFSNCSVEAIVIDNVTPPSLHDGIEAPNEVGGLAQSVLNLNTNWTGFIYVPDTAVSAYLTWADNDVPNTIVNSNRIKSINELTTYATEADWVTAGRPLGLITSYMS